MRANSNYLEGNYIGTDVSGMGALGNRGFGVVVGTGSTNNYIGGSQPGDRNVISGNGWQSTAGNTGMGVYFMSGATSNFIQGNYIGTTSDGRQALGNRNDGVYLEFGADNNTIGGLGAGQGNVISANGRFGGQPLGYGVSVRSNGDFVQGNIIGLDANGQNGPTMRNAVQAIDPQQGTNDTFQNNTTFD